MIVGGLYVVMRRAWIGLTTTGPCDIENCLSVFNSPVAANSMIDDILEGYRTMFQAITERLNENSWQVQYTMKNGDPCTFILETARADATIKNIRSI